MPACWYGGSGARQTSLQGCDAGATGTRRIARYASSLSSALGSAITAFSV